MIRTLILAAIAGSIATAAAAETRVYAMRLDNAYGGPLAYLKVNDRNRIQLISPYGTRQAVCFPTPLIVDGQVMISAASDDRPAKLKVWFWTRKLDCHNFNPLRGASIVTGVGMKP